MIKIVCIQTRGGVGEIVTWWQTLLRMKYPKTNHTGIVVEIGETLFIAEMTSSGNSFKPLTQYKGCYMEVLKTPDADEKKMLACLSDVQSSHIAYGFLDLVKIGFSMTLRRIGIFKYVKEFVDSPNDIVCSNFPRRLLACAGYNVDKIPPLLSPGELSEILGVERAFVFKEKNDLMG